MMRRMLAVMLGVGLLGPAALAPAAGPAAGLEDARVALLRGLAHAGGDDLDRAVALALASTQVQAADAGLRWLPGVAPTAALPSQPALALMAIHGVELSPGALAQLQALDALPLAPRAALADALAAFVAFDAAGRAALTDFEVPHADPESDSLDELWEELGLDLAPVLPARNAFLEAAAALRGALAAAPPGTLPARVDLAPALVLDFAGTDDVYAADLAFVLDLGGRDVYLNNAGGSGTLQVAALLDFGGDDRYVSGRDDGINGGGETGFGFLLDAVGHDVYIAADDGTNGGGFVGAGFLLDAAGNDYYSSERNGQPYGWGVNGGGYIGGLGMLIDQAGDDVYAGSHDAVNGGGAGGFGFLLDAGGHDAYSAWGAGVNGGAAAGVGFLLDLAGDDSYVVTDDGTGNGGAFGGLGLLWDDAGTDRYVGDAGAGIDVTMVPKGHLGAQVDA